MFVDQATIHVQSGAGGNGLVAWRREKYVPFGGPAGGDGGRGGHVVIMAVSDLSTLMDFRYQSLFRAEDGEKGGPKNMHGKVGKDLIIHVPCGTVVRDAETGAAIADLKHSGEEVIVAAGGRGGRGNARFNSSRRQAPQFAEPGEPGVERELFLELKMLAEVGIIGLPNAGKSTLISAISAAKPKIADYPFTTMTPNLGVIRKPTGDGVVVADIPGLVEGASMGVGLGHSFLRHVERTRLLLHLVDITAGDVLLEHFDLINAELARYDEKLSQKPQIVVLSKIDAASEADVRHYQDALTEKTGLSSIFAISAVAHQGLDALVETIFEHLSQMPSDEETQTDTIVVEPDLRAFDHDDSHFDIQRKGKVFIVSGGKINRLFSVTDMTNREATQRLMNILKAMGVYRELERMGVQEGSTVRIAGLEFEYYPDEFKY